MYRPRVVMIPFASDEFRLEEHLRSGIARCIPEHGVEARSVEVPSVAIGIKDEIRGVELVGAPDGIVAVTGQMSIGCDLIEQSQLAQDRARGGRQSLSDTRRDSGRLLDHQKSSSEPRKRDGHGRAGRSTAHDDDVEVIVADHFGCRTGRGARSASSWEIEPNSLRERCRRTDLG